MTKKAKAFSFATFAPEFDRHITTSIRGYTDLKTDCVGFSPYFIQRDTTVLDVGCSTGSLLRRIRRHNQKKYPSVHYVGIDVEPKFQRHWSKAPAENLQFRLCDVQRFDGLKNLSVVYSLFTLQFLPERDRLGVVQRIFDGLVEGGAFILAEKVHAKNAKFHEMLTFMYYDYKRRAFKPEEILKKEKTIRDQMHLWSEFKLFEMLRAVGFAPAHTQLFWRNHLFVGILAMKSARYR
jgi:tRNA (cmo5U34)-methyltransferase